MLGGVGFRGAVGPNVFWPLGGPVASGGVYPSDPYGASSSGSWRSHMPSAMLARCLAAGADHLRLQVSPAPHIQALVAGDTAMLALLDAAHMQAVDDCIAAGLAVHYSPFLSSPNIDPLSPLQGLATSAYLNYRAFVVRMAGLLAQRDPTMVVLGLMNEPPAVGSYPADWRTVVQPDLYAAVRTAAPGLTLAITDAGYSSIYNTAGVNQNNSVQTLANSFDPAPYDANTLIEVHPFAPSVFCLQGANYDSRYKYVDTLEWPPQQTALAGAIARMTALVNADASLSSSAKTAMISSLTSEIGYFFSLPQNEAWISAQFDYVEAWRAYRGVAPHRIYMSEYGAVRQNTQFNGLGGSRLSRVRYYAALHRQITKRGYRSAYDHLDTVDYGCTLGTGSTIGLDDAALSQAIAAPLSKLVRYG